MAPTGLRAPHGWEASSAQWGACSSYLVMGAPSLGGGFQGPQFTGANILAGKHVVRPGQLSKRGLLSLRTERLRQGGTPALSSGLYCTPREAQKEGPGCRSCGCPCTEEPELPSLARTKQQSPLRPFIIIHHSSIISCVMDDTLPPSLSFGSSFAKA